jgi:hypothetical protein
VSVFPSADREINRCRGKALNKRDFLHSVKVASLTQSCDLLGVEAGLKTSKAILCLLCLGSSL